MIGTERDKTSAVKHMFINRRHRRVNCKKANVRRNDTQKKTEGEFIGTATPKIAEEGFGDLMLLFAAISGNLP